MKLLKSMLFGMALFVAGVGMFLQKLTFSDPSNQGLLGEFMANIFGNQQPKQMAGTLFVVIIVCALAFAIMQNLPTFLLLVASIIFLILAVINNMAVTVASMSGLEIGVICAMVVIGLGMFINSMFRLGSSQTT